jgi:hypothetical protein
MQLSHVRIDINSGDLHLAENTRTQELFGIVRGAYRTSSFLIFIAFSIWFVYRVYTSLYSTGEAPNLVELGNYTLYY